MAEQKEIDNLTELVHRYGILIVAPEWVDGVPIYIIKIPTPEQRRILEEL
jgi:hypothetical protein